MADDTTKIQLPDGRVTSARWDDFETAGDKPSENIVVADRFDPLHTMPSEWLRARVCQWMDTIESPDQDYWMGTYAENGRWIWCASMGDKYVPLQHRVEYAQRVCRAVNKHAGFGGVWFTGWILGGHEFYLMWKQPDGDIGIPMQCGLPFTEIAKWDLSVWVMHCAEAIATMYEIHETAETTPGQQVHLSQGQKMDTDNHLAKAAAQNIL